MLNILKYFEYSKFFTCIQKLKYPNPKKSKKFHEHRDPPKLKLRKISQISQPHNLKKPSHKSSFQINKIISHKFPFSPIYSRENRKNVCQTEPNHVPRLKASTITKAISTHSLSRLCFSQKFIQFGARE